MRYDIQTPVAVFLGPSLDVATASSILPANYFRPVRLGDVYRLLSTGVRTVVVIDGVFYASTPVWQRELLVALDAGITVVGAASMGALRAAELAPFGMIGCGTVYRWYREGRINGDDEVALLHTEASHGYKSISEPLVNMRHNLDLACRAGLVDPDQQKDMIDYMKQRYFGERSYEVLFESPCFSRLAEPGRTCLRDFLSTQRKDLKRADAIEALELCADEHRLMAARQNRATAGKRSRRGFHDLLLRGALTPSGWLAPLQQVIEKGFKEREDVSLLISSVTRHFFLARWIKNKAIEPPAAFVDDFRESWRRQYSIPGDESWLRANGLTQIELERELEERAGVAWIVEEGPGAFGLGPAPEKTRVDAPPGEAAVRELVENCFLADWAQSSGIACPPDIVKSFQAKQDVSGEDSSGVLAKQALACWLVERGPYFFGYDNWSPDVAILKEWQVTGQVAGFARALGEERDA